MKALTRENLVAELRSYLGTPFQHIGRSREGVDCIGLALGALHELGWTPRNPETAHLSRYRRWPRSEELVRAVENECVEIGFEELLPGDLLLMKWPSVDEYPRHVATVTEINPIRVIHTHWLMKSQRVAEHILDSTWRARVVSCWRLRDFVES